MFKKDNNRKIQEKKKKETKQGKKEKNKTKQVVTLTYPQWDATWDDGEDI